VNSSKIAFRTACWAALSVLLALPAIAAPPVIVHGTDLFSTSNGTQVNLAANPLPPDFFCAGSAPFAGSIPLTGVPLATVPTGIAGSTDTIVERLRDGVWDTTGNAVIPIVVRALRMRGTSPFTVFCPLEGNTTWQVDACLCGLQPQTQITARLDPACPNCGIFNGFLRVNTCLRFTRTDNGATAGPVQHALNLEIKNMPWCYNAGINETQISSPYSVDTNCDGQPDLTLTGTSNFHPGYSCATAGKDCWTVFAALTRCHENYGHPNEHPHCVNPVCGERPN
jgi:hypothetical protein